LHREPVDGRKAINGLALLVEQALGLNPFEPAIDVFSNRRRDRIKLLHRLYAAKSEARANLAQRDLFLNEAEALAPNAAPVAEETTPEAVEGQAIVARNAAANRSIPSCLARLCAMN